MEKKGARMKKWKDRRKKPWRRRLRRKRVRNVRRGRERTDAGRTVRRLFLALLLGELLWMGREEGIFLISRWEVSGEKPFPGPGEPGEEGGRSSWLGFGADLREGKLYIFRREEQVVK